jgi:hypothetical protein
MSSSTSSPQRKKVKLVLKQFYEKTCDDGSIIRSIKNFREKDYSLKKGFYEFKIKNKTCCRQGEVGVKKNGDCFHQSAFQSYIKAKNGLIYMSSMLTDFSGSLIEINDTFEQIGGICSKGFLNEKTKSVYHYARYITF